MINKVTIKLLVRQIIANILFYSGINTFYRFLARRNQAVVLMYHRVVDSTELNGSYLQPGMYVTKETFEMQMQYLSSQYHVISLEELIDKLQKGNAIRRNTCVITFDDGWRDTYTHAFSILKKYSLPATIFLVPGYVGTKQWFWPERVSILLARLFEKSSIGEIQKLSSRGLEHTGFLTLLINPTSTPTQKIDMVIEKMKNLDDNLREKIISELENLFSSESVYMLSEPLLLCWDEIVQLDFSRITFGSHTKTHAILTQVLEQELIEEIATSKKEIEARISRPCFAFCYPNGDYHDKIKSIVKEHYRCAFTTEPGFVEPGDDLFALKRIGLHNDISFTKALFACRISHILP
jgi:peptidoglycan/xylan/chitin deacetylase (PgdA/CDA1 family)